jgi:hypothetical protein
MVASGLWWNELGSEMELYISGASVSGWYNTAVGQASGQYPLVGLINTDPFYYSTSGGISGMSQALGWVVVWQNAYGNSNSVTTWSAQYQTLDGDEEIVSLWLLTTETEESGDWGATQVGQNIFKRTQPTQEEIEKNRKRNTKPHPV